MAVCPLRMCPGSELRFRFGSESELVLVLVLVVVFVFVLVLVLYIYIYIYVCCYFALSFRKSVSIGIGRQSEAGRQDVYVLYVR